jgi:hypothetical protein
VIAEAAGLVAVNVLLAILGAGILAIVRRPRAESIVVQAAVSLLTGLAAFFAVMPPLLLPASRRRSASSSCSSCSRSPAACTGAASRRRARPRAQDPAC